MSRKIREEALVFLEEVRRRANDYAEQIDPKRKRKYENDPVLAALDGITAKIGHALATVKGMRADGKDPLTTRKAR